MIQHESSYDYTTNVIFPFVIHSGTCAPCRHLSISGASLSWMDVNFLNQKPCILSWPSNLLFGIFFSAFLRKSMCISAFGPSSSFSNSFDILFIQWSFSLCFRLPYFSPKSFSFSCIGFCMFSSHLLPNVGRIFFRCFGMSCFFSVLFYPLSISLWSSFVRQYFLVYFLKLYCYFLLSCLFLLVPTYSSVFPLFYHFDLFS